MKKIFLLLIFVSSIIYADIAKVVALKGKAYISRDGKTIQVKKNTLIERKDILFTKNNSKVQLLFKDETIISIGKNSQLNINEYLFDDKNIQAEFSMIKGMFRTITGKIGKIKPKSFKLKTKTASIGIRGTQIVTDISSKQERIFCTEGQIEITSNINNSTIILNAGEFVSIDILSKQNSILKKNKTKQKDISLVNKSIKLSQNTIVEEDTTIPLNDENITPIPVTTIQEQENLINTVDTNNESEDEEKAKNKAKEDAQKEALVKKEQKEAEENAQKAKDDAKKAKDEAAKKEATDKLAEEQKLAAQKAEQEKLAAQIEADKKAKEEKLAAQKAEQEKLAAQIEAAKKAEELRLAQEKAKAEKTKEAKAEADRLAKEKEEADRLAKEKEEAEKLAKELAKKAEKEKIKAEQAAKKAEEEKIKAEQAAKKAKEEAEQAARLKAEAEQAAKLADLSNRTEKEYITNSTSTASYVGNFNNEPYNSKSQYIKYKNNKSQIPEGTKISMDIDFGVKKDHIKNGKIDFNGHDNMTFKGEIDTDSKIKLEGTNETKGKGEAHFYGPEANKIKGNVNFHNKDKLKIEGDFQADKYNEQTSDSFDLTDVTDKDFIKQSNSFASYHGDFNGKDFNNKDQYLKYLGKNRKIPSYVTIDMDIDFGATTNQIKNGKINFLILKDLEFSGNIKDSSFSLKGTNGTKGSGSGKFYGNEANLIKGAIDMQNSTKNKLKGEFEAIKK